MQRNNDNITNYIAQSTAINSSSTESAADLHLGGNTYQRESFPRSVP